MEEVRNWPKTSDREFSKRMFIIFMWAFFIHIAVAIGTEVFFSANGSAIQILKDTIPVYTTIFAAVIVKGGVENVFKGRASLSSSAASVNSAGSENG